MMTGTTKTLIRVLTLAVVCLCLAFGGLTAFLEIRTVEARFIEFALRETGVLSEQLEHAENRRSVGHLKAFLDRRSRAPGGHLVAIQLLSAEGKVLAGADDGQDASIQASRKHRIAVPKSGKAVHQVHWDDRVYVGVLLPMWSATGALEGFMHGFYMVDDDVVDNAKLSVSQSVATTALIVVLTTAFIFPLVRRLDRNLHRRNEQLLEANIAILDALGAAIAKRDSDTGEHNYRVTYYALRLAEAAGLPPGQIACVIKGAFLHDVGKIGVRDAILLKPGRLTPEEFAEMKTHVSYGLEIVAQVPWLSDASEVVGGHHEKWDGSGYPNGRKGEEIPVPARVFAVADVFDALTSRRPYKEPFSVDEAEAIITAGRGSHFDPDLVDIFLAQCRGLLADTAGRDGNGLKNLLTSRAAPYFAALA